MASLFQRGGRWWAKWYDPPGVVHQKSLDTTDKKEASALFMEIQARLARGRHVIFPGSRPFGEILDDFIADKKSRRETWTWKTYEKRAKHIRRLFPVSTRIGSIEVAHVSAYIAKRSSEGASPQTLNQERTTLSTIFNWAIRRDFAERNPAMKLEPYSVRPKHRPEIDPEGFDALAKDLDAEVTNATTDSHRYVVELLRDAVHTIWWSGLRIGEVARLIKGDIDLKREVYAVRSAPNKGPRIEPMHEKVKAIFERRIGVAKKDLVFGTAEGEGAYNTLQGTWQKFVRAHPTHATKGFHALRHAFNTRMHEVIDNPLIAMRAMGHKTISMSSHYTQVGVDKVRAALKRLS